MPGPRTDLPPWVARHLETSAAILGPEEAAVVVFIPAGLGADRPAIEAWASRAGLAVEFALPADEEELGAGELIRLTLAPQVESDADLAAREQDLSDAVAALQPDQEEP